MADHPWPPASLALSGRWRSRRAPSINIIIGASIFVFPAVIAGELGAAGFLPYLVAALAMGPIALCFGRRERTLQDLADRCGLSSAHGDLTSAALGARVMVG
jgi:hypothetical protein